MPNERIHSCDKGAIKQKYLINNGFKWHVVNSPRQTPSRVKIAHLEGQEAAVDLGRLHQGGAVVAVDVYAPLVARQVDQGELAVQRGGAVVASEDDLEDGVGARGVGIGRGLTKSSGEETGRRGPVDFCSRDGRRNQLKGENRFGNCLFKWLAQVQ